MNIGMPSPEEKDEFWRANYTHVKLSDVHQANAIYKSLEKERQFRKVHGTSSENFPLKKGESVNNVESLKFDDVIKGIK